MCQSDLAASVGRHIQDFSENRTVVVGIFVWGASFEGPKYLGCRCELGGSGIREFEVGKDTFNAETGLRHEKGSVALCDDVYAEVSCVIGLDPKVKSAFP